MHKYYFFDWDCTITQRHHHYFMEDYSNFQKLYSSDEKYILLNNRTEIKVNKTWIDYYNNSYDFLHNARATDIKQPAHNIRDIDDKTKDILKDYKKNYVKQDISEDYFIKYIINLFFGYRRFLFLRLMFELMFYLNINIVILSLGLYENINILLKILLYDRVEIFNAIYICAHTRHDDKLHVSINTKVSGSYNNKSDVLEYIYNIGDTKIYYIDDDPQHNTEFVNKFGRTKILDYNKYMYIPLIYNGPGMPISMIIDIYNNLNTVPHILEGGKYNKIKNDYIKLKNYSQ